MRIALSVFTRLFAPFLPFVTEEIWSWHEAAATGHTSVHRSPWPSPAELEATTPPDDRASFDTAVAAIAAVRRFKSDTRVSLGASIASVILAGAPEDVARLERVRDDVANAARTTDLGLLPDASLPAGEFTVRG
jgi:valyl-tRNA synthetase